jgi:hypothetical protein
LSSTEVIGNFDSPEPEDLRTHLRLTVPVKDFALDLRRYNLISNYVAEYSAYYFEHKDRAENLISSVLYELVEHLTAGSRHEARLDIQLCSTSQWLLFDLSSSFSREALQKLRETLGQLMSPDLDSYYTSLLEEDAEATAGRRVLGLAMIAHDYHAQLSASMRADTGAVTLRTRIGREEIAS